MRNLALWTAAVVFLSFAGSPAVAADKAASETKKVDKKTDKKTDKKVEAKAPKAPAGTPTNVLQTANDKITKLLDAKVAKGSDAEKKRDEKIKKIVDGFLDFESLARRSLGKNWETRTDAEKEEFKKVFRQLIQQNYLNQIHKKSDYEIVYDSEDVEEVKATVYTTVKAKSKKGEEAETTLVYKMKKVKDKWVVFDIVTDEVSLVQNYKSQFTKIINKDGYKVLIQKIQKKLDEGADPDTIE
jgi:phospholipid transport system substrate-binding protein